MVPPVRLLAPLNPLRFLLGPSSTRGTGGGPVKFVDQYVIVQILMVSMLVVVNLIPFVKETR